MNPIFDNSSLFNSLITNSAFFESAIYANAIGLNNLEQNIAKLTEIIGRLTDNIQLHMPGNFVNQANELFAQNSTRELASPKQASQLERAEGETLNGTIKQYTDAGKSFCKIATSGLKLYETIDKLHPEFERAKIGISAFSGAMEMIEGAGSIGAATGLVEGLEGLTGLLAGAEAIAPLLAVSGPVGWAIGGGLVLAAGITALAVSDSSGQESNATHATSFIDDGIANRNPAIMEAQNPEQSIDSIIQFAGTMPANQVAIKVDELKQLLLDQGGTITFDWKKAESGDPVYLKALVGALNQSDKMGSHPIKNLLFDDERDMDAFIKNFDRFQRFKYSVKPKIEKTTTEDIYSPYGSLRLFHHESNTPKEEHKKAVSPLSFLDYLKGNAKYTLLGNAIKSYRTNGLDYVLKSFKDMQKYGSFPLNSKDIAAEEESFLKAIPLIDHRANQQSEAPRQKAKRFDDNWAHASNYSRQISINLNKPMIEHFTINAKEVKEGLNDLKRRVEEILLEILNSANAIH